MQAQLDNLRDKMRQDTERFLTSAMESAADPRREYETLLRELRSAPGDVPPTRTPPLRHRPAA